METENFIAKFISEIRTISELSDDDIIQLLSDKPEFFDIIKQFNQLKLSNKIEENRKRKYAFIDSGIDNCNLGYFNDKGCDY